MNNLSIFARVSVAAAQLAILTFSLLQFDTAHATLAPGTESPRLVLIRIMLESQDGRDCTISFLQQEALSPESRCIDTNSRIEGLFLLKKFDLKDKEKIKLIERQLIEYFLDQTKRQ